MHLPIVASANTFGDRNTRMADQPIRVFVPPEAFADGRHRFSSAFYSGINS
jgi:hypothetical protein